MKKALGLLAIAWGIFTPLSSAFTVGTSEGISEKDGQKSVQSNQSAINSDASDPLVDQMCVEKSEEDEELYFLTCGGFLE